MLLLEDGSRSGLEAIKKTEDFFFRLENACQPIIIQSKKLLFDAGIRFDKSSPACLVTANTEGINNLGPTPMLFGWPNHQIITQFDDGQLQLVEMGTNGIPRNITILRRTDGYKSELIQNRNALELLSPFSIGQRLGNVKKPTPEENALSPTPDIITYIPFEDGHPREIIQEYIIGKPDDKYPLADITVYIEKDSCFHTGMRTRVSVGGTARIPSNIIMWDRLQTSPDELSIGNLITGRLIDPAIFFDAISTKFHFDSKASLSSPFV